MLITGSSGYVGYVLSRFFSEKGIMVIGLDRNTNTAWKGNKHFKHYHCDITHKQQLMRIVAKEKPTHVIHLAFLMDPLHDVKREFEIDVLGSVYALQAANKTPTVKQFILYSSASAYGAWPKNKPWIPEEQPLRPRDYRYGINKKRVEKYYAQYSRRKDMKLVILRMCTAIGPSYHKKGGVVSLLTNAPLLTKIGGRFCELQFLHEDDVTALMQLIVKDKEIDGVYNFAPDSSATTKELAPDKFFLPVPLRLMRSIIGLLWALRLSSVRPAAMTLSTYGIIVDPAKLMKRYNYTCKYSTLNGFRDTVKKRKALGTL